jgi:hypothetical protein
MGVRRDLDGYAGFAGNAKTVRTIPTASVGCSRGMCVGRHVDGDARPLLLQVASVTLPTTAVALCASILGRLYGASLRERLTREGGEKHEKHDMTNGHHP